METKIKVALMTYAIDGRQAKGTAVVARKSVEALLAARDEFDLTFIHYDTCDDPIYTHGVREVIMPRFRWSFLNTRFLRQLRYFVTTSDRFDVIEWFQPRLYPMFWLAPARHVVAALHGAGDWTPDGHVNIPRSVFNWTIRLFNRKISAAIAGSHYAKDDIVAKYKFDPAYVHVINNGADPVFKPVSAEVVAAAKLKYSLPEKFFLNVARLEYTKNALRTMRAFERFVAATGNEDLHLANIGARGKDRPLVDAFLATSPVRDRIHLVGYVENEDLPAVYCAAYALTFPLMNEGLGLPMIEAMGCGTPVLASQTSYPDIAADEAVLVDALSEQSIAEGMRRLVDEPGLRESLREKGFAVAEKLTWNAVGEKLMALLRTLAAR